jgi:hypothetical protein
MVEMIVCLGGEKFAKTTIGALIYLILAPFTALKSGNSSVLYIFPHNQLPRRFGGNKCVGENTIHSITRE